MDTLGLSATLRGPAACLVHDGRVVAAAEEERFVRYGRSSSNLLAAHDLPFNAIDFCLREAGITLADVAHIAYVHDRALPVVQRRDAARPLERALGAYPKERAQQWDFRASVFDAPQYFGGGTPHTSDGRFQSLSHGGPFRWHIVPPHLAHAAAAFLPSPFERAAVLILDGRDIHVSTLSAMGEGASIEPVAEVRMPHSLGALYEQVTAHLGFVSPWEEHKVMAMAALGRPRYRDAFREIVRVEGDGHYTVAPPQLSERFGPARHPGAPLEQHHYDLARSLQVTLEETALQLAGWLHTTTGAEQLCLAGGVAHNGALNARLRDETPFRQVWAHPATDGAGAALGAALLVDAQERGLRGAYRMEHAFLGPAYDDEEVEAQLRQARLPYRRVNDIATATAELLVQNRIVGWFQGRMELGPQSLGARSILASPISPEMRTRLNTLKGRESFRPLAPMVLAEEAERWFIGADESPFKAFAYDVRPACAERIPAVPHVDGSARLQTLRREQHPRAYDIVQAFARLTGVPMLVSTSFTAGDEPLVCTPPDALAAFEALPLDALAIGSFLVEKPRPR